jgi:adenylate cyclase
VAARVQNLAEAGGICITDSVRLALGAKLALQFEDLGAQKVKNIAEPVRAWQVKAPPEVVIPTPATKARRPGRSGGRWLTALLALPILIIAVGVPLWWFYPEQWLGDSPALVLPEQPSIAVLPFRNLSDDAEQEFFVDGLTEDLIIDLAKLSGLFEGRVDAQGQHANRAGVLRHRGHVGPAGPRVRGRVGAVVDGKIYAIGGSPNMQENDPGIAVVEV